MASTQRTAVMPPFTAVAIGGALLAAARLRGPFLCGALAAAGGALLHKGLSRGGPTAADRRPRFARGMRIKRSVRVGRSPEECYEYWRRLENLPQFMDHLKSVRVVSKQRSHWIAGNGEEALEWDAEITRDQPGRMIGWRSLPGSDLDTAGSVRFRPNEDGSTRVEVKFKYNPPAGPLGAAFLMLFAHQPVREIDCGLGRFKDLMERQARLENMVEVASEGSFPASDPPAWTGTGV